MVDDMTAGVDGADAKPAGGGGAPEREKQMQAMAGVVVVVVDGGEGCSAPAAAAAKKKKAREGVVVECRICQEEDEVQAMESPCACNGTLKFAHRKCIQRWCNKKGDINCEICNQVFSPNYSLPPATISPDLVAIDVRRAWGPHINLRDSHLIALAAAERQFLRSDYEEYAVENSSSIACLRTVALVLLIILLLRQALMITRETGMVQESSMFFDFQVSVLQFAGFLLPCYVMARSWYIQSRRRQV
ncbi:hypothetical protein NL676_019224 [Syzygium grande]|nr:hypothetical protein NL676_019224 [Syzygium grande]